MEDTSALRDERRQLAEKSRKLLARIDEIDKVLARQDARPADNDETVRAEQQGDVSVATSSRSKYAREEAPGGGETNGPRKRRHVAIEHSPAVPLVQPGEASHETPAPPVQQGNSATTPNQNNAASNMGTAPHGGARPETRQERVLRLIRPVAEGGLAVKDDHQYSTVVRSGPRLAEIHCPEPTCRANARKVRVPKETGGTTLVKELFKGTAGLRGHVNAKHSWLKWDGLSKAQIAQLGQLGHKAYLTDEEADATFSGHHDRYQVEKCLPEDHGTPCMHSGW
ncbi:hypothetical protein PRZ48_009652 [Zasmidium cellare]|uniref:Transposase n=1 Tax=Zasmidium cellare TaxID=395010 RepID=A0ABR0EDB5_ZASCE|nr:hypothetical protein PRZ48_009652 [Zasmidium cellare]